MGIAKRVRNILRYGLGDEARERKRADKKAAKRKRFSSDRWEHGGDFARRRYESYEEYREHQASKLAVVIDRLQANAEEELGEFLQRFRETPSLRSARSVLCLGARLGTEVRALHQLGHFAVGIDLNPGADNPYVLPGDFHALVFARGSVDAVYTNALDHVFDLEKLISEVRRVLAPGGLFLVEIDVGYGEGQVPGDYEATHWRDAAALVKRICEIGGFAVEEDRDLGIVRRGHRRQVAFRLPA